MIYNVEAIHVNAAHINFRMLINQLKCCRMSLRENEIFLEELRETRRRDRESSEESSESAHGREPSEGTNGISQTECLDSPEGNPPEDDNPRGPVESNLYFKALQDKTEEGLKQAIRVDAGEEMSPATGGKGKTWKERVNLFRKVWQHVTDVGESPNEEDLTSMVDSIKEENWNQRGDTEDNDAGHFMEEWFGKVKDWKLSPQTAETLISRIGNGQDSKHKKHVLFGRMGNKVREAYATRLQTKEDNQESTERSEQDRMKKLNNEIRSVQNRPNFQPIQEAWNKVKDLVPGQALKGQSTETNERMRIEEEITKAIIILVPAAIKVMEDIADQKATESVTKNKHLCGLHEELGDIAKKAAQAMKNYVASKDRDPNMAQSIKQVMDLISALTVGEVIMRTTAEATIHPSPTARVHALMANEAAKKTWAEIMISPDTKTNLRKAAMCLLLKLEGTASPKWRGAAQLMNWVANGIPIMATPIMQDIFPSLDTKRSDRKAHSILMNTASTKQWGDMVAAEQEMPKLLRYSQEEWEAGKYCERKLKMMTGNPLAPKIYQINTLFLLGATADLYNKDTIAVGRKNTETGAKRAAKEGLRNAAMQGASQYLETIEVEYNETTLEKAIGKTFDMGKERLGALVKAAHEATKKGSGKTMDDTFGGLGTKCPDCARSGVDKDIILEPTNPAKGIHEHLFHCGDQRGKNNKRKDNWSESPLTESNKIKRGNYEQPRMDRQMPGTPVRGMSHRGRRARGSNPGRGGYFGNPPNHQEPNHGMFPNTGYYQQGQGPNNMDQNDLGNNGRGFGYHTQEYRNQVMDNHNQQKGQAPWNFRNSHNR